MARDLHVISHPLVQHKLTLLRDKSLSTRSFRGLTHEISALLAYEVMRDARTHAITVETPLGPAQGVELDGKKVVLVAILRAGLGMIDGMLSVLPMARVGHIGLYRDPKLGTAVEYYLKLPDSMSERDVIVVSSVLATGATASAAVRRAREAGARAVRFVCLIASEAGVQGFHEDNPDVPVFTCAVDPHVDARGYIVPGLGDVGDRLYGTE